MRNALDPDVIVVGGGISGLACAWGLQQRGLDVLLVEASGNAGGCIASIHESGDLLEAGPNSALDTSPLIAKLLESLGIAADRIEANPAAQKRFVVRGGKPWALPMSPGAFLQSPLFSAAAKVRLLCEPFIGRRSDCHEETVASFVRRRLGSEFLDYAINPFVGGVYAGRPEQLSLQAAFPRLHDLEKNFGSLIRGQLFGARSRAKSAQQSKHAAPMFSFRDGMATLPCTIAGRLRRIELNAHATAVAAVDGGFSVDVARDDCVRTLRARSIVLAVPAYAAATLIRSLSPKAASALAQIHYPPVAVVHSGWRREAIGHPLDGFGMLVPECEKTRILGCIFSSTLFPRRASSGMVLLTSFIGGARQPELVSLEETELKEIAHGDLGRLLQISGMPEFIKVRKWPRAIPQYTLGHAGRMASLESAEDSLPGFRFCANYRGGVSIGDCIASADRSVSAISGFLQNA
jgi:oxygen-dependent protoporphyrinogen oxidase